MAKTQYPIDGKKGKAWKITSPFGWRVHPIEKSKSIITAMTFGDQMQSCIVKLGTLEQ